MQVLRGRRWGPGLFPEGAVPWGLRSTTGVQCCGGAPYPPPPCIALDTVYCTVHATTTSLYGEPPPPPIRSLVGYAQ